MIARFRVSFIVLPLFTVSTVVWAGPPRFEDLPGPAANHVATATPTAGEAAKVAEAPTQATNPTSVTAAIATPTVASPKSQPSFFSGNRRSSAPLEPTNKTGDALIPTHAYHKSSPEILQQGDIQFFTPGYRGNWVTQSSKTLCGLRQAIPNFGYAEFRQGTSQPLEFILVAANPPAGSGVAQVLSEPPLWSHYSKPTNLGVIALEEGEHVMTASTDWAQRLLSDLVDGMQTSFQFYDSADASQDSKIILSAMNFNTGLASFDKCRAELLRYDVKESKYTVLQFNADSSRLSKTAIGQLEGVLEIVSRDPGIKSVDIEIFSLNKELVKYNYRLATRRAQAVRDYLISKGVDEERLKITIYTKQKSKLEQLGIKPNQVQIVLNRDKKHKG